MEYLNLEDMQKCWDFIWKSEKVKRTPLIQGVEELFPELKERNIHLSLKLENLQTTGAFKMRGVVYQIHKLQEHAEIRKKNKTLVIFSGGNYGKAFATLTAELGLKTIVLMPRNVPKDRKDLVESLGAEVILEDGQTLLERAKKEGNMEGRILVEPFDDLNLIKGYGSAAFEVVEDLKTNIPDIVMVPCGGGGLLSGVSSTLRLMGMEQTRIYGVEPETACVMKKSFEQGHAAFMPESHSIAGGLSPPVAGKLTYSICKECVNDMLQVSDEQIIGTLGKIYRRLKLVVEPSGAAALAALLHNKIPEDIDGKHIVVFVTGSNINLADLEKLVNQ